MSKGTVGKWLLGLLGAAAAVLLYAAVLRSVYRRSKAELEVETQVERYAPPGRSLFASFHDFVHGTSDELYDLDGDLSKLSEWDIRKAVLAEAAALKEKDLEKDHWHFQRAADGRYRAIRVLYPRVLAFDVDMKTGGVTAVGEDVQELSEFLSQGGSDRAAADWEALHRAAFACLKARSDYILAAFLHQDPSRPELEGYRAAFAKAVKAALARHSKDELKADAAKHHYEHLISAGDLL